MAKIRLKRSRSKPLILGGKYQVTTRFQEIPFRFARRLVGDEGIIVEWSDKDRRDMKKLPPHKQARLARVLKLPTGLDLDTAIYRDKDKNAARKAAKAKATKEAAAKKKANAAKAAAAKKKAEQEAKKAKAVEKKTAPKKQIKEDDK